MRTRSVKSFSAQSAVAGSAATGCVDMARGSLMLRTRGVGSDGHPGSFHAPKRPAGKAAPRLARRERASRPQSAGEIQPHHDRVRRLAHDVLLARTPVDAPHLVEDLAGAWVAHEK